MAERSLGVIHPAGNGPVRCTINEEDPTLPVRCSSYRVQHWQGNTDTASAIIGGADMDSATGEDVYGVLPAPMNAEWPMYSSPDNSRDPYPHDMKNVYIDSEDPEAAFLVTIMV